METEAFAFDFTHHASTYAVQVKRFAVDTYSVFILFGKR